MSSPGVPSARQRLDVLCRTAQEGRDGNPVAQDRAARPDRGSPAHGPVSDRWQYMSTHASTSADIHPIDVAGSIATDQALTRTSSVGTMRSSPGAQIEEFLRIVPASTHGWRRSTVQSEGWPMLNPVRTGRIVVQAVVSIGDAGRRERRRCRTGGGRWRRRSGAAADAWRADVGRGRSSATDGERRRATAATADRWPSGVVDHGGIPPRRPHRAPPLVVVRVVTDDRPPRLAREGRSAPLRATRRGSRRDRA